jgi:hypothetical protein
MNSGEFSIYRYRRAAFERYIVPTSLLTIMGLFALFMMNI